MISKLVYSEGKNACFVFTCTDSLKKASADVSTGRRGGGLKREIEGVHVAGLKSMLPPSFIILYIIL
jgi:hypothetical protein